MKNFVKNFRLFVYIMRYTVCDTLAAMLQDFAAFVAKGRA